MILLFEGATALYAVVMLIIVFKEIKERREWDNEICNGVIKNEENHYISLHMLVDKIKQLEEKIEKLEEQPESNNRRKRNHKPMRRKKR